MRNPGTYSLEELVSDIDGSDAYRFGDDTVSDMAGNSWECAQDVPNPAIQWTVDDAEDDYDVGVSPEYLAWVLDRARTCCEACPGTCGRAE